MDELPLLSPSEPAPAVTPPDAEARIAELEVRCAQLEDRLRKLTRSSIGILGWRDRQRSRGEKSEADASWVGFKKDVERFGGIHYATNGQG